MLTMIKIAGKEYPMSFSVMAAKKIAEKFGSTDKALEKINAEADTMGSAMNIMDAMLDMLEILISQGCAYKNYFERDLPVPRNAPVIEGKWTPLPREAMEVALGIMNLGDVAEKIGECISGGKTKGVEAISKNAVAGQE